MRWLYANVLSRENALGARKIIVQYFMDQRVTRRRRHYMNNDFKWM